MSDDERAIRGVVAEWLAATRRGDVASVLALMTPDVVFLAAGRVPMLGRDAFEAAMQPPRGAPAPAVDGTSDVREIRVAGDWAYLWTELRVTVTPPGGVPMARAGPALTILHKEAGRWRVARDANMLAPVAA